jgi:hypothetical protein
MMALPRVINSAHGAITSICVCILLLLAACDTTEPTQVPPSPSIVAFQPDPFASSGIRPDSDAPGAEDSRSGAIIVDWNPIDPVLVANLQVGGYYVYRSDSINSSGRPVNFHRIRQVPVTVGGSDTAISDSTVGLNIPYHYFVSAYRRSDPSFEGPPSDTVSFTLTERPLPRAPIGDVMISAGDSLAFRFMPPTAAGLVAIEVDEVHPDDERTVIRSVWRFTGRADFSDPHVTYTDADLLPGRRYRWRVIKIFSQGQPLGNASRWVTFNTK